MLTNVGPSTWCVLKKGYLLFLKLKYFHIITSYCLICKSAYVFCMYFYWGLFLINCLEPILLHIPISFKSNFIDYGCFAGIPSLSLLIMRICLISDNFPSHCFKSCICLGQNYKHKVTLALDGRYPYHVPVWGTWELSDTLSSVMAAGVR